jgi:hypothetical protein
MAKDYVVCGWYTPDYTRWWEKLKPTLEAVGAPHHFVEVEKEDIDWERQTLRKPSMVHQALKFHDVDCTVRGDLAPLAAIGGDFGVCSTVRLAKQRWHVITNQLTVRSGTMVLKPTPRCRALVEQWILLCKTTPPYVHDQQVLALAMYQVPGLVLTNLGVPWCALPRDNCPDPVILHDQASKGSHATKWQRRIAYLRNPLKEAT